MAVALEMRQGRADNDLFNRLGEDDRLGLTQAEIEALVSEPLEFTGAARAQVQTVVARIEAVVNADPGVRRTCPEQFFRAFVAICPNSR